MSRRFRSTVDRLIRHAAHNLAAQVQADVERQFAAHRDWVGQTLRAHTDDVLAAVRDVEFRANRDIHTAGEREAARSSSEFALLTMPTARTFPHPLETLRYALEQTPAEGMALEFGVYSGQTLEVIATERRGRDVYGFDSFQGLPEAWRPNIPTGAFKAGTVPSVDGAELVVGWFEDTVQQFVADHPGTVAFLHLDADLYSSTRTVLEHVGPRLAPGSIVLFDEYFNYPGWQQHEHRAWTEFAESSGIGFCYEAYTSNNEQVVLRIS